MAMQRWRLIHVHKKERARGGKKEGIEKLVMKTGIMQQQWLREEIKTPWMSKKKKKLKIPEISKGYFSKNKGREFLGIPSEFQDITFPKKVTDKNILSKGPRLYSDKTLPHSAKFEV